jgi:hypothetical protein
VSNWNSFLKRRRIKGIVPSVSPTQAHFCLWCQWIVGERRGLRSQWGTNGHHLGWRAHPFLESLGAGSGSISHRSRRRRNGLLHFFAIGSRFRCRVRKCQKLKIWHKSKTHWHYLGTGQKRVEFRSTWLLGSSFLWNIWPEWLSVVKYWPHQKSTNYFFQLRWKLTWNIRIGFKTKLLISARCVLSVWSYNEGLKIYMKIGKKNGKWLVKGIKPFK